LKHQFSKHPVIFNDLESSTPSCFIHRLPMSVPLAGLMYTMSPLRSLGAVLAPAACAAPPELPLDAPNPTRLVLGLLAAPARASPAPPTLLLWRRCCCAQSWARSCAARRSSALARSAFSCATAACTSASVARNAPSQIASLWRLRSSALLSLAALVGDFAEAPCAVSLDADRAAAASPPLPCSQRCNLSPA
jgi:hypothetical protein